jgi:hypothetical protein
MGQSNMEFPVMAMFDAEKELQEANSYPYIRVMSLCNAMYYKCKDDQMSLPWAMASAQSLSSGSDNWNYFFAFWSPFVSFLSQAFLDNLYDELNNDYDGITSQLLHQVPLKWRYRCCLL